MIGNLNKYIIYIDIVDGPGKWGSEVKCQTAFTAKSGTSCME